MLRLMRFYGDRGLTIVKAFMQYVWDDAGRRYVDAHTGHGVAFLGHRNPAVVEAIKEQVDEFMVLGHGFRARIVEEGLDALSKVVPRWVTHAYLLNSGSEAAELAIKLARRATGRKALVAFTGSFHGRTAGALSLTHNPRYRAPFEPLLPGVRFGRFNEVESVDEVIDEDVAAVFVEPIQGEGGVRPASREFMQAVASRAAEVGALLVVDEVQTGFGRTGRVWAHDAFGVVPDIILAGKAIGGGFPVSAVLTNEDVASAVRSGDHGSTYGGNPLAWAAVKASVDVLLKDKVPSKAGRAGEVIMRMLREGLASSRLVREVRGAGLMIGVELRVRPTEALKCIQERGVLALKAGATVVRLLPPYMINQSDAEAIVNAVTGCVKEAHN